MRKKDEIMRNKDKIIRSSQNQEIKSNKYESKKI